MTAERIAGELPADPYTRVRREDVWEEENSSAYGDYAVGKSYSARYIIDLPMGQRVKIESSYYVEPVPERALEDEDEELEGYGVTNQVEILLERADVPAGHDPYGQCVDWQEAQSLEITYDPKPLIYESLSDAENEARSYALRDERGMFFVPVEPQ